MDLYNYNGNNKRKLSKSIEREENLKRKIRKNEETVGCFRRCCRRKKHDITSINKEKIVQTSIDKIQLEYENINQSLNTSVSIQSASVEKVSDIAITHLKRSPLFNESIFCQKALESYDDPCIECTVQYGPDTWENIPKNLNKQLYDTNKSMVIERLDTFLNQRITDDDYGSSSGKEKPTYKPLNSLKINVNSFINEVIGDGVDRASKIIPTRSTYRYKQKKLKIDNQVSTNPGDSFRQDELTRSLSDPEKQSLKKTFQKSEHSSSNFSLDHSSSPLLPDDYISNETNFDQEKELDKSNSLQDQEPYNWDYQEYQWSSPLDSSPKKQSLDKFMNDQLKQKLTNDNDTFSSDDDGTDSSYSLASVLPVNKRKKSQLSSTGLKIATPYLDILHQQSTFSTPELSENVDSISGHGSKTTHSQQKIDLKESKDLTQSKFNQQPKSSSNLSEKKNPPPTIKPTYSSKLNHNKLQASDINSKNDTFLLQSLPNPSSKIFSKHETRQQNDRLNAISVNDLSTHAEKQKSQDSDLTSTAHSILVSEHPSVLPEGSIGNDDKKHAPPSQTTLTGKDLLVSKDTETKQLKSIINTDAKDPTRSINGNLSTKRTQSPLTDIKKNQPSSIGINNTFNQVRSTYDDIMNAWQHLLERLLHFMSPSNHNIDLSSSAITSHTHSWSTWIPTATPNLTPSDNVGPWWGRRDAHDRTPATFIFANESLSAAYSTETITNSKQMCISTENRPCYLKYYSYSNTYHCCCSSSITVNNSSSSSCCASENFTHNI